MELCSWSSKKHKNTFQKLNSTVYLQKSWPGYSRKHTHPVGSGFMKELLLYVWLRNVNEHQLLGKRPANYANSSAKEDSMNVYTLSTMIGCTFLLHSHMAWLGARKSCKKRFSTRCGSHFLERDSRDEWVIHATTRPVCQFGSRKQQLQHNSIKWYKAG